MKRGIRLEYDSENGRLFVIKAKGKLTLDEITDAILDARDYGHYVIILNCNDTVRECAGWDDDYEPKGDSCALYPIDEYEKCPVCDQVTPLLEYCPECGHKLTAKGD